MNRSDHCNVHYWLPYDACMCHKLMLMFLSIKPGDTDIRGKRKSYKKIRGLRREATKTCVEKYLTFQTSPEYNRGVQRSKCAA